MYPIEKISVPFDTLHVDHFGPLPSINSKRKHVLVHMVVIDGFTKFVRLYAVNAPGTKVACCALEKYFDYCNRPRRIISDRGTCFRSDEFAKFVSDKHIENIKVSVASPQSNGQVERVNRDLKAKLAKLTEPINHPNWVQMLLNVEFAINNTVHASTKQIPSKMLFGGEQQGKNVDEMTEHLRELYVNMLIMEMFGLRQWNRFRSHRRIL